MLSGVQQGYGPNEDLNINPQEYLNDNGMLWIKAVFSSTVPTNQYYFVFFSNNENTFTLESIDSGTILKTFTKNGSIHFLKTDSLDEHNGFVSSLIIEMSKKGIYIKFNGIPIIKWAAI